VNFFKAILFFLFLIPVVSYAGNVVVSENSRFVSWIDRDLDYRYLLVVENGWGMMQKLEQASWVKNPKGIANQQIEGHFNPSLILIPESKEFPGWGERAVLRLDVARNQTVHIPTLQGKVVELKLNQLERIVLAPKGESPPSFTIRFGQLFFGAPYAADPSYSPSICTGVDMQTDPNFKGRYQNKFKADSEYYLMGEDGYFGCREWAAQLYDENRPYIDVTSYEWGPDITRPKKGGKYPVGPVTYIKPFIGFSRFQDAPKPVIGQHLGQWYCITDCPEGNAPGKIENIRLWAAKQGWPVPERPENVRRFINQKPDYEDFED